MAELVLAAKKLPGGKAPGSNGIVNEILKSIIQNDPEALLTLFDICWRGGHDVS